MEKAAKQEKGRASLMVTEQQKLSFALSPLRLSIDIDEGGLRSIIANPLYGQ